MDGPGQGRHRFVLGPLLGSGTFGEVYLARMTSYHGIEQEVAVKLLNPGVDPRSQPVSRMRDEGRMLAGLNHPAILQVMDFCNLENRIGLVTEFVPGADLDACLADPQHPITPRASVQVIGTVADALHAAFESRTTDGGALGLVHRDIKPANIRVTPHGSVKLLDFGIAKSEDLHRETATQHKMAFGTPAYMAPEVLSYEVLQALPSRDVFALGCTLFEALIGERYFEGLDHKTIGRVSNREARFSEWRASRMLQLVDQDPMVVDLLSGMLSFDHEARPTAKQVAEVCFDVADGLRGDSLWAWARSHPWPKVSDNTGPWTGRTVVDTQFDFDGKGAPTERRVDPKGRVSAIGQTDDFFSGDAGPVPPVGSAPTSPPPMPMVAPSAALPKPHAPGTDAPSALPLQLFAAGALFLAGLSLVAVGFVAMKPDVILGLFGADASEPAILTPVGTPRVRRDRKAARGDTAAPAPAGGGASFAWGASPGAGAALSTVLLDSQADVTIGRPGKRDQRLTPWSPIRVEPGPIEVKARLPGGRQHEWQFDASLGPSDTMRILCDDFGCKQRR